MSLALYKKHLNRLSAITRRFFIPVYHKLLL